MGRYGEEEEEEEEEEGIEIILPEIVPELFTSNEAWILKTEYMGSTANEIGLFLTFRVAGFWSAWLPSELCSDGEVPPRASRHSHPTAASSNLHSNGNIVVDDGALRQLYRLRLFC